MTDEEEEIYNAGRKRSPLIWFPVGVVILILISGGIWGLFFSGEGEPIIMEKGWRVHMAKNLHHYFEENWEEASSKLMGKTIAVSGVVTETGMSIYATPNVMLSDSANGRRYAICVLPRADSGTLSQYKAGQQVIFQGRVYRVTDGGEIVLKDCRKMGGETDT